MRSKRNTSNSSNLSDHHQENMTNPAKKSKVIPLISDEEVRAEQVPSWANLFVTKFNELHESIQFIGDSIDKVLSEHKSVNGRLEKLENEQAKCSKRSCDTLKDISELKSKQLEMEVEMHKANLIFSGITETQGNSTMQDLVDVISHLPGIGSQIEFDKCFRLGHNIPGKTRDILAAFKDIDIKYQILSSKQKLPKNVYVKEDLPFEVAASRRELMPIFRLAKANENYKKMTKFKGDTLVIGRTAYSKKLTSVATSNLTG